MTRSRSIPAFAGAAAVVLATLLVAGCGGGGSNATHSAPASTARSRPAVRIVPATVAVTSNGKLGKILVDSQGRTLYLFEQDSGTKSTCSGACATAWPPLRASGKPTAGSGAKASALGTTPRSDGKPQVTYNGHPLYGFQGDSGAGDTTGQGSTGFGAPWYVLSGSGNAITTTPSSSNGSGSGY